MPMPVPGRYGRTLMPGGGARAVRFSRNCGLQAGAAACLFGDINGILPQLCRCRILRRATLWPCHGLRAGQSAARRAACGMLCVTVGWWRQRGSNPRPAACDAATLPAELCPHMIGRSTEVSGAGAMIVAAGRKPAAGATAAVSVPGTLQDPCSPEVTLLRILYPTAAACGGRQRHMPLPPAPGGRCPGHARQDCRTARAWEPSCRTRKAQARHALTCRRAGRACAAVDLPPPGVRHARASGPRARRSYQPIGTAMI